MDDDNLVTLRTYPDEILAGMARTALESEDIQAIVSRDDCGGMEPQLNITGGVRLIVKEADAKRADQILDSFDEEE